MHSEAIISENEENVSKFFVSVDAAALYHNASTRFTDGSEFGFGAEIGISTQKLHVRGPMGLPALTSHKIRHSWKWTNSKIKIKDTQFVWVSFILKLFTIQKPNKHSA